ncbi:tetraacyldisaccharide 4'-kinase [Parabacteroides sp. 52]|uniref:tetraacyldisaccharide 4'-kinase n=1 Tax=unclassified Parabacteroides TaxID=2649774 RepID=UPI0013D4DA05|nr:MULTISPECIES: tetraacyldisaccharide 4'-kinase [unclassified Parabacteroides]MDH6534590.1 tetraacyldisaccharide 4'-kinase [Parabacteroides sp. PM5-20]NDV55177.1 tetraacyldisaccharide 4'-kinase [Parabacteroides sp. 52]
MPSDSAIKPKYYLAPFAFFYGLGVRLRNQLFNWGILPVERYPVPVICIGNLTVGGTGKTPHTEYLIRMLQKRYKIAVLSRGYKRKSSGYLLATTESTSEDIGDEPYQIKRKFPHILLAVDSDRRRGIRNLLALPEEKKPEVILLDDGFQHRYVKPSLSILLTDYHRLFYYDKLLPVGRLREHADAVRRTDIVIVTKCEKDLKPIEYRIIEDDLKLFAHQELFFTRVIYDDLKPVFPEASPRVLRDIRRNDDVLVISGIASSAPFVEEISRYSKKVTAINYPDHHSFEKQDIQKLRSLFDKMTSTEKLIIVTEKDAARLLNNPYMPEEWKPVLYALPITVTFCGKRETLFDQIILKHIKDIQHKGFADF